MPPKQEQRQSKPQTRENSEESRKVPGKKSISQDDNKIVQIPLVTLKKFRGIFEVASNRANWRTEELLPVGLIVRDIDLLINHFDNPPNKEKNEEK